MHRRLLSRAWPTLCVLALLLPCGSCGTSGGGGSSAVVLVGGTLPPNPIAYALTPSSDSLIGDDDSDLPSFVDLRNDGVIPPVQNQRWNSCVAWTLGYYIMTAVEAQRQRAVNKAEFVDVRDSRHWFSPDFIYSQRDDDATRAKVTGKPIHCVERDGELGCMRPEKALRILMEQGCPKWDWMCDDGSTSRFRSCAVGAQEETLLKSRRDFAPAAPGARLFRPRCFVRFGSLEKLPTETIDDMKTWLADQRTPIAIVVKMSAGWVNYRGGNRASIDVGGGFVTDVIEERGVCLDAGGQDLLSQHMMTIIGYDDEFPTTDDFADLPDEKEGSFLVINQWGNKWGDRGTMWVPYSELRKVWVGAYAIIGGDGTGNSTSGVECAQDDEGRWIGLVECDDVPKNLDKDGVPKDTTNLLEPTPQVHTDQVGHIIQGGTCLAPADGGVPRDARDTADWFHFVTPGPDSRIEIELRGLGGGPLSGDLDLRLIDEEQDYIASSLGTGTGGETIRRTLCAAGRYLLKVFPKGDADSSEYTLTLRYRTDVPAQPDDELCGANAGGSIPTGGTPMGPSTAGGAGFDKGPGDGNPEDWWKFQAAERSVLLVYGEALAARVELWKGDTPDTARLAESKTILGPVPIALGTPDGLHPQSFTIHTELEEGECAWARFVDLPEFDVAGLGTAWTPLSYRIHHHFFQREGDDTEAGATELDVEKQADPGPNGEDVFAGQGDPNTLHYGVDNLDWYRLMMPPGGVMTFTVHAPGAASQLAAFINGGVGGTTTGDADRIVVTATHPAAVAEPRLFTMGVLAESGTGPIAYQVEVEASVAPGADGANFLIADLAVIELGGEIHDVIGGGDAQDHFRAPVPSPIDPAQPPEWILSLTGFEQSQPPPVLTMRVWDQRDVDLLDAGSTDKEVRMRGAFQPGDDLQDWVVIGIREGQANSAFSDYVLRIWRVPAPQPAGDDNDTPPLADPLVPGTPQTASVGGDDPRDYFIAPIDPAAAGLQTATVTLDDITTPGATLRLTVWGAEGQTPKTADVTQGAAGGVMLTGLPPGTLLRILVEPIGGGATSYRVSVSTP